MEPQTGDLIEIFRKGYQHWAVYIGDGYVVHLVAPDSAGASSTVSGGSVRGQVRKEKLLNVTNKDNWRVNNVHDNKWKPRPKEKIVAKALSMVGKDVKYSVSSSNCEHFATSCRYDKPVSVQAQILKPLGLTAGVAVVVGCVTGVPALAAAGGLFLLYMFKGTSTSSSTS